ncbi:MAG: hypothetical protein FJX45_01675 [Alphaproteobacteria bacterium]|nr:hypothetical protein [Alphaproteobacteria bacterium]MBM3651399.1 hypothetical protein [Alphaproteobacteria bacterium]
MKISLFALFVSTVSLSACGNTHEKIVAACEKEFASKGQAAVNKCIQKGDTELNKSLWKFGK